jgi:hypothetical protein
MPALIHSLLLTLAVGAAYWWVKVPELNQYSLQAIAYISLLYFLIKRVAKAKLWHVMPAAMSVETALATFGFLILIGSTGNTSSILYPLTYIHLFLIVFSSHTSTSIAVTMEIMLYHYALDPRLTNNEIVSLSTLPLVMLFFLFAKRQHEEIVQSRMIIKQESSELEELYQEDNQVRRFTNAIQTKIGLIGQLILFPQQNQLSIQSQLAAMQLELEKLQGYLKKQWFALPTTPPTPQHYEDSTT